MQELDFSPFSRLSVGFDRMFGALRSALQAPEEAQSWPSYNIRKTGQNTYRIELAGPGFSQDRF